MPGDLRRVLAAEGLSNFGSMLSRVAIPWLAALVLQATPWQMAALLVADVVAAAPRGMVFAVGAVGSIAGELLVLHQLVGDGGHTVHDVYDRTLRQTAVDARLLARVDAGIRSVGQLATLAGAAAGGLLGTAWGTRSVLGLAAVAFAVAAALAALTLARRAAPAPLAP